MKRFTQLFTQLEETNRTGGKVAALELYFREAAPADAAWALHFLCGRRLPRALTSTVLREWAADEASLPAWLIDECYDAVGDLAETIALVLPRTTTESSLTLPLHAVVEQRLLPLRSLTDSGKRELLVQTWREMDSQERLVLNKLITGGFRVGVAQTLVVRALAAVAGIDPAVMAHRLLGRWEPVAADFLRLLSATTDAGDDAARPYPFFLASPIDGDPSALGDIGEWQVEWKWDGIRAQLIRRNGGAFVWSRGDESVTDAFPEVAEAAFALPDGTVLDGELLAWRGEQPAPFGALQRRLGRKSVSARMRAEVPVVFLAYDLLEWEGRDWRPRPQRERRRQLESIIEEAVQRGAAIIRDRAHAAAGTPDLFEMFDPSPPPAVPLRLSPLLRSSSWAELESLQRHARERGVEGIMLKRASSAYGTGRQRGDWWKWKVDPMVIDAVLISAQPGHGKRASLFTDYTFGVWHDGKLTPVAKAYSGLTDEEIAEVDTFVRANTTDRFGPIRAVRPVLVFELAFDSVQRSTRHKSGLAMRLPRMSRWRHDKKPEEADTLENLRALMREQVEA